MTDILITSSVLIIVVFSVRLAFQRMLSCRLRYALWGLVVLRLLLPVQLPAADFSVLNGARTVQTQIVRFTDRAILPTMPETVPVRSDAASGSVEMPVRPLTTPGCLNMIWIAGMTVTGGAFLISNLRFRRFLYRKRKLYGDISTPRAIYLVKNGLPSPCLYGLFRPSIYVTPTAVADPKRLRYVIAHEETHIRHGDPLWALLRCVCLTVYWFDPLVWAAAFASKVDCELACDEGTLARLEESERIAYGETLLSLIPVRHGNPFLTATAMTAGKRQLRDRISRIAKCPRQFAAVTLCVVLLSAFVCACTFTGKSRNTSVREQMEKALADSSDGIRWKIVSENNLGSRVVCGLSGSEKQSAIAVFKRIGDKSEDIHYELQSLVTGASGEIIACVLDEPYPAQCAWLWDENSDYTEIIFSNNEGEDKATLTVQRDSSSDELPIVVANIPYESCSVHIACYSVDGTLLQSYDNPTVRTDFPVIRTSTGGVAKDESAIFIDISDKSAVAEARKILLSAFSYDAISPEISHENTQGKESVTVTFRNQENESDFYTVTFADGVPYPVTAYHFMEYADSEQADIANDPSFTYNSDMTDAAKDFVKKVCGVDCSPAAVSAYGYSNKVCVALTLSEKEAFLVSFHYRDLNPVGIRVALNDSLVQKTMEIQQARLLYP